MSVITYTSNARAPLMAGHAISTSYSFEIGFMAFEKNYNSPKTQHRALDGTAANVLKRDDDTLNITIGPYDSTDESQIEEFIKSVAGGETFTADVDGTIATPDTPISIKLSGSSNSRQRLGNRTYSLAFNVLVV